MAQMREIFTKLEGSENSIHIWIWPFKSIQVHGQRRRQRDILYGGNCENNGTGAQKNYNVLSSEDVKKSNMAKEKGK